VFKEYAVPAMLGAIHRALEVYKNPQEWKKIQIRGMKADFSWTASSREYVKLYSKILRQE